MQFHIEMFHIENATKFGTLENMEENLLVGTFKR